MKLGGKNPSTDGFTVVESLIVLTITAALGVSVFALISNRQRATEFRMGANATKQQMQQILNETSSGYFPLSTSVRCQAGLGGSQPTLSNGSSAQGSNQGCIFLGKVVQFASTNPNRYYIYPIAGNRVKNGLQTTSLTEANPVAVARGISNNPFPFKGINTNAPLQYGFQAKYIKYKRSDGLMVPTGAFGYLSEFSTNDASGYTESGSQRFRLYGIRNSGSIPDDLHSSSEFADILDGGPSRYEKTTQVDICLSNGMPNQSALVQIGNAANKSQTSVTLDIRPGNCS